MIQVSNLSKFYGDRKAIDSLNFNVNKGEILGFLGPNGAGKTTTMKILTCFMPASSGSATVAGYDVFESPIEVKKRVGYLPETPPVYKDMVVQEYLMYKAALHQIYGTAAKQAVDTALQKCSLEDVRKRLIGNLSKGYRQRVGLAQAIVHNPDVLVLDEPTVGLDPKQIIEIRELIKSFANDHTVILSTHILPEVQATCSRVLIINQGKIVAIDKIEAISAKLGSGNNLMVTVRTKASEVIQRLRSISEIASVRDTSMADGTTQIYVSGKTDSDVHSKVTEAVLSSGAELVELKRDALSLEDIFLKLTASTTSGNREMTL